MSDTEVIELESDKFYAMKNSQEALRCRRRGVQTIYKVAKMDKDFIIKTADEGNKELHGKEGEYILFIPGGFAVPISSRSFQLEYRLIEDYGDKKSDDVSVSGRFSASDSGVDFG